MSETQSVDEAVKAVDGGVGAETPVVKPKTAKKKAPAKKAAKKPVAKKVKSKAPAKKAAKAKK